MAEIILPCGLVALVDNQDWERVRHLGWRFHRYVYAYERRKKIYLHRAIMNVPCGVQVDHRNGDSLNNRRANLRAASRSQNNANRRSINATGYRCIELMPSGKYRAYISALPHWKSKIHLGAFDTPEEAAQAYDAAALKRWGEFARLNFPQERIA